MLVAGTEPSFQPLLHQLQLLQQQVQVGVPQLLYIWDSFVAAPTMTASNADGIHDYNPVFCIALWLPFPPYTQYTRVLHVPSPLVLHQGSVAPCWQ